MGRRRADVENQDNGNDFLSDFVIVDEPEWQFKSVNKPRSKYSVTGQALNGTSRIVGNTIGKAVVLPARLVGVPFMELTKHSAYKKVSKGQMHKTHDVIPGWNGTKYGSNKTSGADILADFRRVPTVWSYLTAGKASDGKDAEGPELRKAGTFLKRKRSVLTLLSMLQQLQVRVSEPSMKLMCTDSWETCLKNRI